MKETCDALAILTLILCIQQEQHNQVFVDKFPTLTYDMQKTNKHIYVCVVWE